MKKNKPLLTLIIAGFASTLQAQEAKDPFANKPDSVAGNKPVESDSNLPKIISLCYETFSLPLATAAAYQREGISDSLLYQRLVDGLEKGISTQEFLSVIRTRSGEHSTNESVIEKIYPTEFEPPELPNSIGIAIAEEKTEHNPRPVVDGKRLVQLPTAPSPSDISNIATPAHPTTFDTRNTGFSMVAEALLGADNRTLDIRLSPQSTFSTARTRWGKEESEVEVPTFETSRLNTAITATDGKPCLIGTMNRPPHSKIDTDAANKVWFAFVTPKIMVVKP